MNGRTPPTSVLAFIGFVLLLVVAALLVIFETGNAGERVQVLDACKYAGPVLLAGVPAAAAFLRGESTRNLVQKIDTQTNGTLDARIRSGALNALHDYHTTLPAPPAPVTTSPAAAPFVPAQGGPPVVPTTAPEGQTA